MIKQGVLRRIGNGESIHVWTLPWLNNDLNPLVSTNSNNDNFDFTVSDLIEHDNFAWRNDILVGSNFNHDDAHKIRVLPF